MIPPFCFSFSNADDAYSYFTLTFIYFHGMSRDVISFFLRGGGELKFGSHMTSHDVICGFSVSAFGFRFHGVYDVCMCFSVFEETNKKINECCTVGPTWLYSAMNNTL